ncbi:DNA polymerase III subunit delta [Intestinimonas butyriciproducens]|uniref:DNA polymerase III subunit delta n=1 Tax=Intestinimonas butyriciproducens TaxID=1297617 RepID=UPI00051BFB2F|nr:DNA polymerase III subunit delta [Intestinimonas butyriciproducens]
MRGLDALVGNAQVKHRLQTGRGLSHAYILAGPSGTGKRTLGGALSSALVCSGRGEPPCGHCPDCRKAGAGVHPDVIRIGLDGKDISVSQIRELRADAYVRPNEAARKVYVLENAQTMNGSAQNALLKLLEDGPAYAAFLLLTDNAGNMLATVRSRCELLNLSPVTPAECREYLLTRFSTLPRERVLDAAGRCEGVLGRAVAWLEGGGEEEERIREAASRLASLLKDGGEGELLEYCVGLEKWDRDALSGLMDETVQQLRDGLLRGDAPGRSLRLIGHIQVLKEALSFHVGAGHIAGWLCAGAFAHV